MFSSPFIIAVQSIIVLILLIQISLKQNILTITSSIIKEHWNNRTLYMHLLLLGIILLWNKAELFIEETYIHTKDLSYLFHKEGDWIGMFQANLESPFLTYFFSFFYIVILSSLLIAPFFIFFHEKREDDYYTYIYAIIFNYVFAIPFYLFFPINEVWSVHNKVSFLIPSVYPNFETEYRGMSGINNCFPSLHTSLSLTVMWFSYMSQNRLFKYFSTISAITIIFSIFYLGIHWISDMVGGVILSLLVVVAAKKLRHAIEKNNSTKRPHRI